MGITKTARRDKSQRIQKIYADREGYDAVIWAYGTIVVRLAITLALLGGIVAAIILSLGGPQT